MASELGADALLRSQTSAGWRESRPRAGMTMKPRVVALGATSVVAMAAFGTLAIAVAKRKTSAIDRALHPRLKTRRRSAARRAADPLALVGKWWVYLPLAGAAAMYLMERQARHPGRWKSAVSGAESVLLSGLAASVLGQVFDRFLPQPPAPPGHRKKRKPVFPSGHAFGPSAVAWTTAYVFHREGQLHSVAALLPAVAYPSLMVSTRLVDEKHWASDALGGFLAGAAVSAGCAALYEARRSD